MIQSRRVTGNVNPVENPLKHLRHLRNLTIEQVAVRCHVSRQFVIRSEQAVYSDPPETLLTFFSSELEINLDEVKRDYYAYQYSTRRINYGRLIEPWAFSTRRDAHPFISWRELSGISSSAGICKLYCVHPATINKFESRPHLLSSVPEQLVTALLESGYSAETLDLLELAYVNFKINLRNGMEVTINDSN